jgi:hypothetical protein
MGMKEPTRKAGFCDIRNTSGKTETAKIVGKFIGDMARTVRCSRCAQTGLDVYFLRKSRDLGADFRTVEDRETAETLSRQCPSPYFVFS